MIQAKEARPSRTHSKLVRVLVVEENLETCGAIADILGRHKFEVRTVATVREAFRLVSHEAFHIVLVELKNAGPEELQLIEAIESVNERTGVIAMTDLQDLQVARAAMRAGSREFLTKPFDELQLMNVVNQTCRAMGLIYTDPAELNRMVGQRIRAVRTSKNLTLRQLSGMTGITKSQLSQVELGKNAASIWRLALISAALEAPLSNLLHDI